jgi:hypothetical protein
MVKFVPQLEMDDPRWDVTRDQPVEESEDFADLVQLERLDGDGGNSGSATVREPYKH